MIYINAHRFSYQETMLRIHYVILGSKGMENSLNTHLSDLFLGEQICGIWLLTHNFSILLLHTSHLKIPL